MKEEANENKDIKEIKNNNTNEFIEDNEQSVVEVQKEITELDTITLAKTILIDIIHNLPVFKEKIMYFPEKKPLSFLQKKILLLQSQNLESFGSLSNLKKSYSRVQKEQMKLKENLELEKKNNEHLKDLTIILEKTNKYLGIQEPKIKRDDDNSFNLLGKKRNENDQNIVNCSYSPIKKRKIEETYEDFGSFMSKAIKNKPKIQIQKEKFLEEQSERRKQELKNRTAREEVLKFEM